MTSLLGAAAPRLALAAGALAALIGLAMPSADAAPTTDDQGFVDSTARCAAPDTAAAFGSTSTSRVAVCKSPNGSYEYRGVRIRDGAKLVLPATRSGTGAFIAENDGNTYTLTSSALVVTAGSVTVREESMIDFHGPASSSGTTTASTSATTPATTSIPSAKPDIPTPTTKLGPPLPAEVGGGR